MNKVVEAHINPVDGGYVVSVLTDIDGFGYKVYHRSLFNLKDLDLQSIADNGSKLDFETSKKLFSIIDEDNFLEH